MKKHLVVYAPNKTDATALYRASGPLLTLERADADLVVRFGELADWTTMRWASAVMLQRPMLDSHVALVDLAKANRRPVWVDYDDDLYCVPPSNPTHKVYSKPKSRNNVTAILAKADLVTVSTACLADRFKAILEALAKKEKVEKTWVLDPEKIHVVPNAYDDEQLVPLDPANYVAPNKLICWRGSSTHNADLMVHAEAFCKTFAKHLDWTINMIGEPYWVFVDAIDRIPNIKPTNNIITETLDPINYFDFLRLTRPSLMIVPLEETAFNEAKSNICWLEGLHAGAITLAPDWPEWRRPGIINYKDAPDFGRKLDAYLTGFYDHKTIWSDGAAHVNEHLLLSKVNRKRSALLDGLLGR